MSDINDKLDTLLKIKELVASTPSDDASDGSRRKQDKEESLAVIVAEQRYDYDYLLRIYERAGTKENALLTAAFGIIAYIYYVAPVSDPNIKLTIAQRLFIPAQDYGKIIYFMAAGLFVYALYKLVFNVFGDNLWQTVYETPKTDYKYRKLETLEYVKNRYDECYKYNLQSYEKRKKDLTFCFYGILVSAIVLIVVKTLK